MRAAALAASWLWVATAVPADEFRETWGRIGNELLFALLDGPATGVSFLGRGDSFRIESADGARPPPDAVRFMPSAAGKLAPGKLVGSLPGTGEGALELGPCTVAIFRS